MRLRRFGIRFDFVKRRSRRDFESVGNKQGGIFFIMLETIIVILLVLWLLGLVTGQLFGGVLHVLLLVALVVFVVRLLNGRAAV